MQHRTVTEKGAVPFSPAASNGFTLVELLVAIGIIIILIGILLPVVSKVRGQAHVAGVQNQIRSLEAAIEQYHGAFGAYPGPLANDEIYYNAYKPDPQTRVYSTFSGQSSVTDFDTTLDPKLVTGAENLVLGLFGGLRIQRSGQTTTLLYDPSLVGNGPLSLNVNSPKKYPVFGEMKNLSWRTVNGKRTGHYEDDAGAATDTIIPEILDTFPSPLPILYLRARVGVEGAPANGTSGARVNVILPQGLDPKDPNFIPQQYDLKDAIGYTTADANGHYIGVGRTAKGFDPQFAPKTPQGAEIPQGLQTVASAITKLNSAGKPSSLDKGVAAGGNPTRQYYYPYDAYAYFEDPANRFDAASNAAGLCRAKDRFVLISAGLDRVYGTADDICSFGNVLP
ncbi:MAG TPA: prepilin-type N-terminal cleavage/methylation domain-containing protein [Tepidisphaeraceae bacterium]|jgi:type II secretory pathway pseudopilin PulG